MENLFGLEMPIKSSVNSKKDNSGSDHRLVQITAPYHKYMDFFKENHGRMHTGFENSREALKRQGSDEDSDWRGGTFKELFKENHDLDRYQKAKKKLESNKVLQKIITQKSMINVPRRARSAHDGDYDLDKKYDFEPFQKKEKKPSPHKIVKLYVYLCFNANSSAEYINEYGSFIVALVNVLETNGCLVDLVLRTKGTGYLRKYTGAQEGFCIDMPIKKPDEYLPVNILLRTFSSNFMRRVMFSLIVTCAQILNVDVSEGLGYAWKDKDVWKIVDNKVHILSAPNENQKQQFFEDIFKLLGKVEEQI